jgi:Protein of unknown function (DUF2281).
MTATTLVEQIASRAATLPPELQAEVLDFVEFIRSRRMPQPSMQEWLAEVWGSALDFPDRPQQPPLESREPW